MSYQITFVLNNQVQDKYQPIANAIACFIDQAQQQISNSCTITFTATTPNNTKTFTQQDELFKYLDNQQDFSSLRAVNTFAPNEHTYLELNRVLH